MITEVCFPRRGVNRGMQIARSNTLLTIGEIRDANNITGKSVIRAKKTDETAIHWKPKSEAEREICATIFQKSADPSWPLHLPPLALRKLTRILFWALLIKRDSLIHRQGTTSGGIVILNFSLSGKRMAMHELPGSGILPVL